MLHIAPSNTKADANQLEAKEAGGIVSSLGLRTAAAGRFAQDGVVNELTDEEFQNEAGGRPSVPMATTLLLVLRTAPAKGGLDHPHQHLLKVVAEGGTVDEGIPRHEDGIEGLHHGLGTDAVAQGAGTVLHVQRYDEAEEVGDGHLHGLVGPGIGLLELAVEDGTGERFEAGGEGGDSCLGGSSAATAGRTTTPLTGVGGTAAATDAATAPVRRCMDTTNATATATATANATAANAKRSIGQHHQAPPLEQSVERPERHERVRTGRPGIGDDAQEGRGERTGIVGKDGGRSLLLLVHLVLLELRLRLVARGRCGIDR
mmetsp:Transcript_22166/g.63596  ORF Transcript_22166/g.63596 Transcript_22166/m.63596 type:complete len:317 (-) Transcript_22166:585-1535(-)